MAASPDEQAYTISPSTVVQALNINTVTDVYDGKARVNLEDKYCRKRKHVNRYIKKRIDLPPSARSKKTTGFGVASVMIKMPTTGL